MSVSFSGIYDIRFPYGTGDDYIEKKYAGTKEFAENTFKDFNPFMIELKDSFCTQKTNQRLAEKGIRISSSIDNPVLLSEIFDFMSKNSKTDLVQQYINKSKVELVMGNQIDTIV